MLKTCGATQAADIELLVEAGADLIGLWCGVPGGHAELSPDRLTELAELATAAQAVRPVLVTLAREAAAVAELTAASGLRWVQLHGYQQPATVRTLKSVDPALAVIKVLHVQDDDLVEHRLISAYERAGVDMFLIDSIGADGALGSTGRTVSADTAFRIAELVTVPFLLAGGISATNAAGFRALRAHPRFAGIDVDSGSRDEHGRFDPVRIAAIRRAWAVTG